MLIRTIIFLTLLIGVQYTELAFKLTDNTSNTASVVLDTIKKPLISEHSLDSMNILKFDSLYTVSKTDAERVYFAIMKWSIVYSVPEEMLFGIAWKETTWMGRYDSSYSIRNRIIEANTACNGPMQVIWSTAKSMSKMYDIPLKDKNELRYNISKNIQLSAALVNYLNTISNDAYSIFVNYNGHPAHKYNYASSVLAYIKTAYKVDANYLKTKLKPRK